jgi:predicted ester cyclase
MHLPAGIVTAAGLVATGLAMATPGAAGLIAKRQQQVQAANFENYVQCLNAAVAAVDTSCSQYESLETGRAVAYLKGLNLQNSTAKVDTLVRGADRLIARLIVSASVPSTSGGEAKPLVFAKHVGVFFDDAACITEVHVQVDLAAIHNGETTYVDTSVYPNEPAVPGVNISDQFAGYMEVLQTAKYNELDKYFNQEVTQGGNTFPLQNFSAILASSRQAMPDLLLHAEYFIADQEKQQLAVFVKFNGTLVKQWDVISWEKLGPSNTTINFEEYVLYWWQGGKIRRVINTLDSAAFY